MTKNAFAKTRPFSLVSLALPALLAAFALVAALATGCSSGAGDSVADGSSDADATAEAQADAQPSGDSYKLHVTFSGLRMDLPEGWTAVVDGDTLTMETPEGGAADADVQGSIYRGAAAEGGEQDALNDFTDGILQTLSSQQGYEGSSTQTEIDGHPATTGKCTLSADGGAVDIYFAAVAVDGNITSLMMASSEGDYNAEFESIIDSISVPE